MATDWTPHPDLTDGCGWLVERWEYDEDGGHTVTVECGAQVFTLEDDFDGQNGWRCDLGHHHFAYGSARQQQEEREEWLAEQRDRF